MFLIDTISSDTEYFGKNFVGLHLEAQQLDRVEFDGCTFESCDFSEGTFKKCSFADCQFIKCNLSVVKIGYSKFNEVTFEDCKMIGIDWTKGHWPGLALGSPLEFRRCAIDTSSFYGMSLKDIVMEECRAHDADFREADFRNADFSHTDFSNSLFSNTNLVNSNFYEATNYSINVHKNQLDKAKFSRLEAVSLLESLGIELID